MPYSGYTMEGSSLLEMISPPFRSVEYNDSGGSPEGPDHAMRLVTFSMRDAFRLRPLSVTFTPSEDLETPPDITPASFTLANPQTYEEAREMLGKFIAPYCRLSPAERAQLPKASDLTSADEDLDVNTPWRQAVYNILCHVFVDSFPFLGESGGEARYGHYHHPTHELFVVADGVSEVRSWDRHVMMLPVYLAEGVTVKLLRVNEKKTAQADSNPDAARAADETNMDTHADKETTEVEKGRFDEEQPYRTWWIKRGEKVRVVFERKGGAVENVGGPAAVMLVGLACDKGVVTTEEEEMEYLDLPSVGFSPGTRIASVSI